MDTTLPFAPELPGDLAWLHVERAVDLRHDLANHVVLLAFVSPGCVHSRIAMAALELLDLRFASRPLAVIGVCVPGTPAERDPERLALCADELGWRVPLALDVAGEAWRSYGCRVLPTLVLVDCTGRVRFQGGGEPAPDRLRAAIDALLAEVEYGGYGYGRSELPRADPAPLPGGVLGWASGLAWQPDRGVLWVADAARHRLFEVAADGAVLRTVGCGLPGFGDGAGTDASFHRPRGLCWDAAVHRLLVADSGNHAVRAVDPDTGATTTIAGTGRRGRDRSGGLLATEQDLAVPWGIACRDDAVWIACAGLHQLWRLDRGDGSLAAFVGNGNEHRIDGRAAAAALAQPRGLAESASRLLWVDASHHALRAFDLESGEASTLIGAGPRDAGAADGALAQARLQEPGDVVVLADGRLLVVDTGNDAVRLVDPAAGSVRTVPSPPRGLLRPSSAVLAADGMVVVADAGQHRLLCLRVDDGEWSELALRGLVEAPAPWRCRLRARADCTLHLPLPLPPGAQLRPEVPVRVSLRNRGGQPLRYEVTDVADEVVGDRVHLSGVSTGDVGEGLVEARIRCATGHGDGAAAVVHAQDRRLLLAVTLAADAATMARPEPAPAAP